MKKLTYILLGIAAILAVAGVALQYQAEKIANTELVDTKISFLGDGRVEYSTFHTDTVTVDSTGAERIEYVGDSVVKIDEISEGEYEMLKTQLDSTFTFSAYDLHMGSSEYASPIDWRISYSALLFSLVFVMAFGALVHHLKR